MKILLISHSFYPMVGGIETVSEGLADAFFSMNNEVHVLTHTTTTGTKHFPYTVIRNPKSSLIIRELRWADVVLENNPSLRLSWPNLFVNKPMVVCLHTWIDPAEKFGLIYFVKKLWLKKASKVIACSNAIRKETFEKAVVIENFYNDKVFRRVDTETRSKDFVFLGRLVSDKGISMAIDAFIRILKRFPNSNFTIIGEGKEMKSLQQKVETNGLASFVTFKGTMQGDALVNCLNEHRFLLVPSIWKEPYGIVVLEGLACGCIPLVSNGGGLPDAAGNAGLVFERGDLDDLTNKMIQLMDNKMLRENFLIAADQHLREHTLKWVANNYLQVMESAI